MMGVSTELSYGAAFDRTHPRTDQFVRWTNEHPRRVAAVGVVLAVPALVLTYIMSQTKLYLDFRIYLMGAHHLTDPHLYNLVYPVAHLKFTYPPIATLFFWPATLLPFALASFVWTTLTLAALFWFILLIVGSLRPDLSRAGRSAIALLFFGPLFFFEPILENFHFGQVNIFLALLTLADVLRRPRRLPQGIMLGLATAIKLVPGIFLLYLLVRRQYRACVRAALTIVGLEGVMLLINRHATHVYWKTYAFDVKRVGNQIYNSNQSVRGAVQRLAHAMVSNGVISGLSFLVVALGLLVALAVAARRSEILTLAVIGFTGDLASPISWTHHLVWFVPLVLWLALSPNRPKAGPSLALGVALVLWTGLIWLPPHDAALPLHWSWWESIAGNADFFLMLATLLLVATTGRPRRTEASS
jgi:alpha-1,2-mannosyltransferase